MNYPPPPPPPPPDAWAGYTPPTTRAPLPPPPAPKPAAAPIVIVAASQPKRINVRNKGQRGEREVVGLLQAIVDKVRRERNLLPIVIQRNQMQSHSGGEDLAGLDGFAVEVKFQ